MARSNNKTKHVLLAKRCCAVFLLILLAFPAFKTAVFASSIEIPEISATKITYNSTKTRFTAEVNKAIGYNVYVLENPYRVIIDIPDAIFNLSPSEGDSGDGLISGFRFGQIEAGRSRIVLDVTGPVLIENSYAVRKKRDRPARLIVDLISTDAQTFKKIHQLDQVANLVARQTAKDAKIGDGLIPQEQPPVSNDKNIGKTNDQIANLLANKNLLKKKSLKPARKPVRKPLRKDGKILIVIDPGHGGIDGGARSKTGILEKNVVLAFSKVLKTQLKVLGRYDVRLTRETDKFLRLRDRVKIAHENKADLFIAVHADSIRHTRVRGTTIYTLSEKASDREAEELARKENRADIIGGVDLKGESKAITNILIELAQRETKNHSVYFAKKTVGHLRGITRLAKRPMRSAGFVVLKAPDVPSILVELGYLSNRHDANLINSAKWQKKVTRAFARAIDSYFRAKVALQ